LNVLTGRRFFADPEIRGALKQSPAVFGARIAAKENGMDANAEVLAVLKKAGKPLKSAEVVAAAGLDKKEVEKAIRGLKKEGAIISPKACYYSLA
jgi:biotin operon repressor